MDVTSAPIRERRRFARSEGPSRFAINLLRPRGLIPANNVNVGGGGLCVRLEEELEVRSLVRMQLTAGGSRRLNGGRPVECTGRVAWVIQRMDLRDMPPFLFDVGIEFVDPPLLLRQLMARPGQRATAARSSSGRVKLLDPALIQGRTFHPRVERELSRPSPWHLVVLVDGVPCFSGHYASERLATAAWAQFKRRQVRLVRAVKP